MLFKIDILYRMKFKLKEILKIEPVHPTLHCQIQHYWQSFL